MLLKNIIQDVLNNQVKLNELRKRVPGYDVEHLLSELSFDKSGASLYLLMAPRADTRKLLTYFFKLEKDMGCNLKAKPIYPNSVTLGDVYVTDVTLMFFSEIDIVFNFFVEYFIPCEGRSIARVLTNSEQELIDGLKLNWWLKTHNQSL